MTAGVPGMDYEGFLKRGLRAGQGDVLGGSSLRPAYIRAHERGCPYDRVAGDGVVADAIGEGFEPELVHIGDRELRHERGKTTDDAGEPGVASEVRAAPDECLVAHFRRRQARSEESAEELTSHPHVHASAGEGLDHELACLAPERPFRERPGADGRIEVELLKDD